jgi:hypothetical protein
VGITIALFIAGQVLEKSSSASPTSAAHCGVALVVLAWPGRRSSPFFSLPSRTESPLQAGPSAASWIGTTGIHFLRPLFSSAPGSARFGLDLSAVALLLRIVVVSAGSPPQRPALPRQPLRALDVLRPRNSRCAFWLHCADVLWPDVAEIEALASLAPLKRAPAFALSLIVVDAGALHFQVRPRPRTLLRSSAVAASRTTSTLAPPAIAP